MTKAEQTFKEKDQLLSELSKISSSISGQFGELMKNIQWYATLVVAEIAGISKLTSQAHGWIFTLYIISILFLFTAIISLVTANIKSQEIKFSIESTLLKFSSSIQDMEPSEELGQEMSKFRKDMLIYYDATQGSIPLQYSKLGLYAFLAATIFGGLGLILS